MTTAYEKPIDLLKHSLGQIVFVRTRNHSQLRGRLVCYDEHLNMMLSKLTIEQQGKPERNINLMYVRGDGILLISPDK